MPSLKSRPRNPRVGKVRAGPLGACPLGVPLDRSAAQGPKRRSARNGANGLSARNGASARKVLQPRQQARSPQGRNRARRGRPSQRASKARRVSAPDPAVSAARAGDPSRRNRTARDIDHTYSHHICAMRPIEGRRGPGGLELIAAPPGKRFSGVAK